MMSGTVLNRDTIGSEVSLGQEETTRVQKAAAALKQVCTGSFCCACLCNQLGVLPNLYLAASQADLEQSNEPPQSFTIPTEEDREKQPDTTGSEADTQNSQASPFEGSPPVSGESPAAVAGGDRTRFASIFQRGTKLVSKLTERC